ncbi:distal tail protein Dit [Paraclostridium sordellii]|uniref:Phage tail component n=1 Tax=Paraclostridium sordellii TaxID=1505 RepID=A0A9P1P7P3_PARSO|nr:distal tail protein Dit [Paeniclostridium sordellii]CEN31440.1 phage tail component [[Clostridium] sordellii] [Paeniclostridium sordellii]
MFSKYFLIFNNLNSKYDLGLSIVKRPNIPSPSKNKITKEIPGRDGLVYEELGGYKDIVIPVEFNFIEKNNLKERFRQVKLWINDIQDNKLIFSDDIEWFYRVVDINLNGDFETILRRKGLFKIDFTCRAYQYMVDGDNPIFMPNNSILYNCYLLSKPLLKIVGNGNTQIAINNKTFTVPVKDYVYVDSELELAYKYKGDSFNISKGKFPVLEKGANKITYSSNITHFEITPRWRCL